MHQLAEIQVDKEDWKSKAATALKEMLGMVTKSEDRMPERVVQAFENAFARQEAAQASSVDPTIYPFARRQR